MNRPVIVVASIILLVALVVLGCTNKELIGPAPEIGQEVVSTCVTCHTDKDLLKEIATPEEEEESEVTTGEG